MPPRTVVLGVVDVGDIPSVESINALTSSVTALGIEVDAVELSVTTVTANTQTVNYTLALSDAGKVIEMDNGSARTITVPPNSSVAFPVGTVVEVYAMGAGTVTIEAGSGVTVRNVGALAEQYATASLRKRATNEWILGGDLA